MNNASASSRLAGVPLALLLATIGVLYAATLKRTVSGCPSEFCVDIGEIQVALATWGTVHSTGYPLYMLVGSPFVALLHSLGVRQAEASAWYSWVMMLGALGMAWGIYTRATGSRAIAAAAAAGLAVLPAVWLHGSIPEVYALHLVFITAVIGLTLRLRRTWSDGWGLALALVGGLGVAHHRLLAPLLVVSALVLLPSWWKSRRRWVWLGAALALFILGFLPYIDPVLRARTGAVWVYDRPDTWDGFWRVFQGSEFSGYGQMAIMPGGVGEAFAWVFGELAYELTTPVGVVLLVGAAASPLTRSHRAEGLVLSAFGIGALLFSLLFYRAVLLAATHMPVLIALTGLAAIGFQALAEKAFRRDPRRAAWQEGLASGLLLLAALIRGNWAYPEIAAITSDDQYERIVRTTTAHLRTPAGAVLMVPWGQPYFALAYDQLVDGELNDRRLVDHRADLRDLADDNGIYTLETTLSTFGIDWFRERLGPDIRINSAGGGWVEIGPALEAPAGASATPFGDGIALIGIVPSPISADGILSVEVDWTATSSPINDYSTYVHASDQIIDDITDPAQMIAQSDSGAPVFGHAVTSQWQPGQLVREDHALTIPAGVKPQSLFVGMYRQTPDGQFVRLGQARWILENGQWVKH